MLRAAYNAGICLVLINTLLIHQHTYRTEYVHLLRHAHIQRVSVR